MTGSPVHVSGQTDEMDVEVKTWVAPGGELVPRTVGQKAKIRSGDVQTWADLLVAQLPYNVILGPGCLYEALVVWDFAHHRLMTQGENGGVELPVAQNPTTSDTQKALPHKNGSFEVDAHQADDARRLMVEDLDEASA